MILQELVNYYERMAKLEESNIAPIGLEWKEISFAIVIDKDGRFVEIEDLRTEGKKPRGRACLVPQGETRTAGVKAQLLWDNIGYILGYNKTNKKRGDEQFAAFRSRIEELIELGYDDTDILSVNLFLKNIDLNQIKQHRLWEVLCESKGNISFRLMGESDLVCQTAAAHTAATSQSTEPDSSNIVCLVTGQEAPLARTHPLIKGVFGAQPAGASIVSFNQDSFTSFSKSQGGNAPVGTYGATAYTTALNSLLARESRQKLWYGETSVVFWADKQNEFEGLLFDLFNEPPKDDPAANTESVKALYHAPNTGVAPFEDDDSRFFVLGLGPNAGRLSIRFWHVSTVSEMATKVRLYFDDLDIIAPAWARKPPTLIRLLQATALRGERKNIEPSLPASMLKAILDGTPFPTTIALAVTRRIRAEAAGKSSPVTYERAAILKAYINRISRLNGGTEKEMTIELDESNSSVGYCLGRLFAVLEKIQSEALNDVNAPIRDRYYAAASATPVTCFPLLMRMKNHHLSKLTNKGRVVNLEKLIAEIVSHVSEFPAHLNLSDQGRFAIGYYHQRQNFFNKSDSQHKEVDENNDSN